MFTGIIEEIGCVKNIHHLAKSVELVIESHLIFDDLKIGDSVSTNGVCLTVTRIQNNTFSCDVMNETLQRSSLGALTTNSHVNLERAMPANGRFGGHIVSGHIDGTGKIISIQKDDIATWYKISASKEILRYIVEKGSIAIDGISLTVASVSADCFSVSIIPHTASETILSEKHTGSVVNLENDIIGKYVEALLPNQEATLSKEFLLKNGF